MNKVIEFFTEYFWLLQVAIILFAALLVNLTETWLFKRELTKNRGDYNLVNIWLKSLHKPLKAFIWLMGLSLAAQFIELETSAKIIAEINGWVRPIGTILIIYWYCYRVVCGFELRFLSKAGSGKYKRLDATSVSGLTRLAHIILIILTILILLPNIGVPISGILAFGGVSGFAIAFAGKDMLSNFFGGLMIYFDRPFSVGDWVRSPDKDIEGTVEKIGWRLTKIRTFDKRPLYIPNGNFLSLSIENPSRMTNRRIKQTIGVRYEDGHKLAEILTAIEDMLKSHPDIDTNQTLYVHLINFGTSSLDFEIYTFTKTTNWVQFQAIQQDVLLKVLAIITDHGAECAYPTRTLVKTVKEHQ